MRSKQVIRQRLRQLNPTFRRPKVAPLILTALLLLNSGCASDPIQIPEDVQNIQWCHPFLNGSTEIGASCDNFLTSNPETLNSQEWQQLMQIWLAQGGIPECTTSKSMTALKVLVENVCSQYPCNDEQRALVSQVRDGLNKIEGLGGQ